MTRAEVILALLSADLRLTNGTVIRPKPDAPVVFVRAERWDYELREVSTNIYGSHINVFLEKKR